MPKVSVLIAAYNVAPYLGAALESVIHQTLTDIEIICVDDCSTDETPAILEQYAQKDPRIRIIRHEQNRGTYQTRCDACLASTGDFILFLDGDDYLEPDTCEAVYAAAVEHDADVVQFNVILHQENPVPEEFARDMARFFTPCTQELSAERGALVDECFCRRSFNWGLLCKLFRRQIVLDACRFSSEERLVMAEDLLFLFMILLNARGYKGLEAGCYHYRIGIGISTATTLPLGKMPSYANEYLVCTLLKSWLEQLGCLERHRNALKTVQNAVYNDIARVFLQRLDAADCEAALPVLLEKWPPEEFAIAIAQGVYCSGMATPAEAAARCRGLKAVRRVTEIKNVGTFHYRLYSGGIERVISLLSPIWQAQGYRVTVLTEEERTPDDYPLPDGVIRAVLPEMGSPYPFTTDDIENRIRNWCKAIRKYDLDAVVSHTWNDLNQFIDQLACTCAGIPYILHTHNSATADFASPNPDRFQQAIIQGSIYPLADVVITLSEVDQAWWQATGLRSVRVMNPPTFCVDDIIPAPLNSHDVLWVGRLSSEKQYYEAFEIAKYVHEAVPDMRLRVVGSCSSEEEANIRAYLERNGLSECVVLEGYHLDVAPFFQSASVLLWTAAFEGAPMAMAEGKAFGLPLVTYDLINVDMVRQRKGMIVVPQKAVKEAAAHIIELLQNDEKRLQMGREARASAEEMARTDLGKVWDDIFALSLTPHKGRSPTAVSSPLEAALQIDLIRLFEGQQIRQQYCQDLQDAVSWLEGQNDLRSAEIGQLQQQITEHVNFIGHLQQQNAQYAVSMQQLTHSHIFTVGRIATWPFRKLKALLRRGKALFSRPKSAVH